MDFLVLYSTCVLYMAVVTGTFTRYTRGLARAKLGHARFGLLDVLNSPERIMARRASDGSQPPICRRPTTDLRDVQDALRMLKETSSG